MIVMMNIMMDRDPIKKLDLNKIIKIIYLLEDIIRVPLIYLMKMTLKQIIIIIYQAV